MFRLKKSLGDDMKIGADKMSKARHFNNGIAFWLCMAVFLFTGNVCAEWIRISDDIQDPPTLDPLKLFDDKSHNLIQQIFDGLLQFDSDGNLQPALAISWERIDPLTMRFHLRPNVHFHNGEVFDAEAVKFSVERHVDPKSQFPGFGFVATIASVQVVDPMTVDIKTHIPDSLLLRRLAGFIFMLPPKAYSDPAFGAHPVGTGAYKFKEWIRGDRIEMVQNPGYWDHRPSAPTDIQFCFIPSQKQVELLLQKKLDIITELPGTFTYQVASSPNTKVIKRNTFYTISATFNTSRAALKDVRVRRAINYAINREDLIRYDVMGNGTIIAGLSMPGEIGHDPDLKPYEYNPEKAKTLLAEAGVKLPLELKTVTKTQGDRTARLLKENLHKVGIELVISEVGSGADAVKILAAKDADVGITGFPDVIGHIFFTQSILFYSKSPFSLYFNPEYDKRLEAIVMELDPAKNEMLAQELDRYVHDQALSIFTYQQIRTYGVSRDVNFTPSVTSRLYCNRIEIVKKKGLSSEKK